MSRMCKRTRNREVCIEGNLLPSSSAVRQDLQQRNKNAVLQRIIITLTEAGAHAAMSAEPAWNQMHGGNIFFDFRRRFASQNHMVMIPCRLRHGGFSSRVA